ncbi:MAG: 3-oxoacyl-ACP reductase FabG [Bdellovibrionales bacterium]
MTKIQFDLSEKKVVVTGGASGIGFEISRQFLMAGAQVTIWDLSEDSLNKAAGELSQWKNQLKTQSVNVGDRTQVAAAASLLDRVDVVVNNAGITKDKSFAKMTPEDWDAVIQVNLTGLFNVTKSLLEKMTEPQGKRIINISSVVGLYGNFGQTNYAAAKAGVIGMTKTWAKELGKKGFCVNAIAPGFIRTAMTSAMPAEVLQQMAAKVPTARLGETSDIANAVLFLSSDQASYINGSVISVDGGLTL